MKTSQHTLEARKRHHKALEDLAESLGCNRWKNKGLQLWRKLRVIEYYAHAATTDYTNGDIDDDQMDKEADKATIAVSQVLGGKTPPSFHVNRDPRGYALKLLALDNGSEPATKFALHQDWGRNQILAPEIED